MMLQLQSSSTVNVRWFDLSVLSAYGHENEQLLFAANSVSCRVEVASIRIINDNDRWVQYRAYLRAINLYDDLLRHKGSPKRQRGDDLIALQIEGHLEDIPPPSFITTHFEAFCGNQGA